MKIKINIISIICLLLLSVGCDDIIDKLPLDDPSSATFPSTEGELELALNSAYRIFVFSDSDVLHDIFSDCGTDIGWIRGDSWGGGYQVLARGEHSSTTGLFLSSWKHYYKYIQQANFILENLDKVNDAGEYTSQVEAQLKVIRAFGYIKLTESFGDVCLLKTSIDIESAKTVTRTDKELVVDFIIEDLDFAINVLPNIDVSAYDGHLTKGAALMLKARVALNNERYAIAANAANTIMESGLYKLYSDYEKLFTYDAIRNSEVIFDVSFHPDYMYSAVPRYCYSRRAKGWSIIVPSQNLVDSYECTDGLSIDKSPLYVPSDVSKNRDPRLAASIVLPQSWYIGFLFETHPDSTKTYNSDGKRIGNLEVTNAYATFTGYLWRKYCTIDDYGNEYKSTLNIMLMRYAEVLLTYAEAKIELNEIDLSVYDAINEVRQRVNMPIITIGKSQEEMRYIVRHERKIELAGEGFRLNDIRRWRIAEYVLPGKFAGRKQKSNWYTPEIPTINDYDHPVYQDFDNTFNTLETRTFNSDRDYLWSIPQSEIDAMGDGLVQNPGY